MKKILIIEDDVVISRTLADNLLHEGFEVMQAYDGEDGMRMALTTKPDLIVLDILLPKIEGLNMLKKIREDPWGKTVPVIVISNSGELSTIAAALDAGVDEYLLKVNSTMEDTIKIIREKLK